MGGRKLKLLTQLCIDRFAGSTMTIMVYRFNHVFTEQNGRGGLYLALEKMVETAMARSFYLPIEL